MIIIETSQSYRRLMECHNHRVMFTNMKWRLRNCFRTLTFRTQTFRTRTFHLMTVWTGRSALWHFGPRRLTSDILDQNVSLPDILDLDFSPTWHFGPGSFAPKTFRPRTLCFARGRFVLDRFATWHFWSRTFRSLAFWTRTFRHLIFWIWKFCHLRFWTKAVSPPVFLDLDVSHPGRFAF